MKNKKNGGQSLFEIIIALAIVSLIAVGLVRASGFSVKNTRFSADQSSLTALAQKRIAQIVDKKNSDYQKFFNGEYLPQSDDFPCEGDNTLCVEEHEDYCLKIQVNERSEESATIVTIKVDAYWGRGEKGTDCGEYDYSYKISFKTEVTD
jgi:Tfp pilus assembly protein PilV